MAAESILRFEALGYRDARGRFAKRSDILAEEMRDAIRDLSRSMVKTLYFYAPKDTKAFADGIKFRTTWAGERVRSNIYVGGMHAFLLPMLTGGTQPHLIPLGGAAEMMQKGYPLHWVDKKTGEHRFAWEVWHPGTDPDPFVALAIEAMDPQFDRTAATVARRIAWLS